MRDPDASPTQSDSGSPSSLSSSGPLPQTPESSGSASRRSGVTQVQKTRGALQRENLTLAASLSLLATTLESTMDGVVALDLQGRVVAHNSKFTAMWGLASDGLIGSQAKQLQDSCAPLSRDPEGYLALEDARVSHPEEPSFDVLELRDGRTLERYGNPQLLEGACLGTVISYRDVTHRRVIETALRLSEEKYRLLWATSDDAFVLFNTEGTILEVNHSFSEMFGYSAREVLGQELSLIQPERLRETHRSSIRDYIGTGQRNLNWRDTQAFGLHKDGRELPLEIVLNHLYVDGQDLFAAFIRDVSERRRAEQSLAMFAAIVDSSHDAIISKTLEGIVTSWNPGAERIFGYSADEMIGQPIIKLFPPDRVQEELQILEGQARGERLDHFETVRVRKDGTHLNVSLTISPIKDGSGQVVGVSKIARDITDRKAADAERERLLEREQRARLAAEAADRTKDEFLATLSHELRTPLNSILGWATILNDSRLRDEERAQGLEIIQRNAQLQARLVEDILDVSRIVTGKLRMEVRQVNLVHILESAVESVVHSAEARDIRLQRVVDSGECLVKGDPDRLQQVLWNLLSNAIKFTPNGGRVQVRLELRPTEVELVVQDDGSGIAPEILPYIFDRFRQADQSSTRNYGGLGLGLAIVKHIVEYHGGSVSAASEGLGHGATFTVRLPLLAGRTPLAPRRQPTFTVAAEENQPPAYDCPAELNGLHILAVDDDEDARLLIKTVLENCGVKVTLAASSEEAYLALQKGRPDILLSDLGMPGENGYSLIERVRALSPEQGGDTPAAAITAYARVEDRLKVLRHGFQFHVPKPIEPAELITVVTNLAHRVSR